MGLFDFLKGKTNNNNLTFQNSHKPQYMINGHFLYMGDFSGEYCQSPNGQFILAWKDQFLNESGKYILLKNGQVKLYGEITRPNDGMVSNSGVFILSDWTSQNMNGIFYVINADGETLIQQRCKANLDCTGISDDGHFAICKTLKSNDESDSIKLFFFDVKKRKLLWKKCPETPARSYRFDTNNRNLYIVCNETRAYGYTFDGIFIDRELYRHDCINIGYEIEFLKAVKEWKEELDSSNSEPRRYNEVLASLKNGLQRFSDTDTKSKIHRFLGEIYTLQGNNSKAVEHLEIALELNPKVGVKKQLAKLKNSEKL